MNDKELRLIRLLQLKCDVARSAVSDAQVKVSDLHEQLSQIAERRNVPPNDPRDQIHHERHLGWLDNRAREVSVEAARAQVVLSNAKAKLATELGRQSSLSKALGRRDLQEKQRKARQLS